MSRSYDDYRREVDEYLSEARGKPNLGGRPGRPGGRDGRPGGGRDGRPGTRDGKPDGKPDKPDSKKPDRGNEVRNQAATHGGRTAWDRMWDAVKGELSTAKDIIRSQGASIKGVEGKKEKHHTKGN